MAIVYMCTSGSLHKGSDSELVGTKIQTRFHSVSMCLQTCVFLVGVGGRAGYFLLILTNVTHELAQACSFCISPALIYSAPHSNQSDHFRFKRTTSPPLLRDTFL